MWKLHADVLGYHRSLLADEDRLGAFSKAIAETVAPGAVVADVGAGTGILSLLACRAGAARVYAIDQGIIARVARDFLRRNGVADQVTVFQSSSLKVELPEKVDVIVSETLWNAGLGEGIVLTIRDASTRFLREGGVIVPQEITLRWCPVESPAAHHRVSGFPSLEGIDVRELRRLTVNNVHRIESDRFEPLAEPADLATILLGRETPDRFDGYSDAILRRPGTLHGVAVWFRASLTRTIQLENSKPHSSWKQAYFPTEEPVEVERGDLLRFGLSVSHNEMVWSWEIQLTSTRDGRVRSHKHSTLVGFPSD